MCAENQYVRIITKVAQGEPTIPPSPSHNNGDWLATDIYEGELYIDSDTGKIYTRLASGIVDIGSLSDTNIYNTDGTLTANRVLLGDNAFSLIFNDLIGFALGADGILLSALNRLLLSGNNDGSVQTDAGVSITATGTNDSDVAYEVNNGFFQAIQMFKTGKVSIPSSLLIGTGNTPIDSALLFDVASSGTKMSRPVPSMGVIDRDSVLSPVVWSQIINATTGRPEYYHPFWGWHPVGEITPDWGYWWIDEATGASGEFVFSATNGGLLTTLIDSTLSPTRLAGLSTGVNTNGEYRHITNPYLLGSTGLKSWSTKVAFDTLSNITNRYVARSGYVNNSAGLSTSIGMYFLYDEGGVYGTATASANWLCVCFTSGSPTIVDSGIPVISSPANPLQKLQILDSGTGNNVKFYIDNALVATITTQIPTSSQTLSAGNIITKQAGTTARIMYDDYVEAKEKFNTPR